MNGQIILNDLPAHTCTLPWQSGGYGSTGYEDGSIFICFCGQAYFSAPCFEHFGPVSLWKKVRWYHFGKRKRIEQLDIIP